MAPYATYLADKRLLSKSHHRDHLSVKTLRMAPYATYLADKRLLSKSHHRDHLSVKTLRPCHHLYWVKLSVFVIFIR